MNVRRIVIERASRRCERCGRYIRDGQRASVHHRLLRSQGGKDSPENCVLLCGSGTTGCHGWVHANPAAAQEQGFIVRSHEDPSRVPILTPRGLALIDQDYAWMPSVVESAPMTVQELLEEMGRGT